MHLQIILSEIDFFFPLWKKQIVPVTLIKNLMKNICRYIDSGLHQSIFAVSDHHHHHHPHLEISDQGRWLTCASQVKLPVNQLSCASRSN